MDIIPLLPHFQAALNLTTICLIAVAYSYIRREDRVMHRKYMIAALSVSGLFMVSYLIYHSQVGNVKFVGEGAIRPIYFTILISHIILAAAIIPMVLTTVFHASRTSFKRHQRWAKWTFPAWIYVSISGIVIYLMAFHIYPPYAGLS
ncbi:hypothetical protein MNBD_GAMMA26-546 [hydrothermal vent metagenome]|uniref:Uncharacterized protein n=1 Tax=hydrothermal vent metagenome TaxID=652676 RepID=A0A3B1B8N8_9ZZZZ